MQSSSVQQQQAASCRALSAVLVCSDDRVAGHVLTRELLAADTVLLFTKDALHIVTSAKKGEGHAGCVF